jgi:poly(A) polymerase
MMVLVLQAGCHSRQESSSFYELVMVEKKTKVIKKQQLEQWLCRYPDRLFDVLHETACSQGTSVHLVGGALRDWLYGAVPTDLDFTIDTDSISFLKQLRKRYGKGTIVVLGNRSDNTCRLVLDGLTIDAAGFRKNATTIEEDLCGRDFTINALAVSVRDLIKPGSGVVIIDPLGGVGDMDRRLIRSSPGAFTDDPLRLLRAYRFAAQLGYEIEPQTLKDIAANSGLIESSAPERISYECDQIMLSPRAYQAMKGMGTVGLLEHIAPELWSGDGIDQPSFHHENVLQHNLETLNCMEQVCAAPSHYFPDCPEPSRSYLQECSNLVVLKWAALFHDVGKPAVKKRNPEKDNRVTFYNHDAQGARLFLDYATRLKWSKRNRQRVSELIDMHMHPFHLCNTRRQDGKLSRRALLKICRRAGDELPGLFLLAMADSLAGRGPDKPEGMEKEVADLYCTLDVLYQETIRPILQGPKLLTGADLLDTLGLEPGPLFKTILTGVETARVEGIVNSRDDALQWVRAYLGKHS